MARALRIQRRISPTADLRKGPRMSSFSSGSELPGDAKADEENDQPDGAVQRILQLEEWRSEPRESVSIADRSTRCSSLVSERRVAA